MLRARTTFAILFKELALLEKALEDARKQRLEYLQLGAELRHISQVHSAAPDVTQLRPAEGPASVRVAVCRMFESQLYH